MGLPGSGKGTQSFKISSEFGYTHISTGDLLRNESKAKTDEGEKIRKIQAEGGLVSMEITISLLIREMCSKPSECYIFDGFPRSKEQADFMREKICAPI